jgi:hypothetical protein
VCKQSILAAVVVSVLAAPAVLAEPPSKQEKEARKEQMKYEREERKRMQEMKREERKHQGEMEREEHKYRKEMKKEARQQNREMEDRGGDDRFEKQREKHTEYHEEGKGSQQGQAQRDEVKKKWWRFWESDE